jgi:hypothetical protein
MLLCENFHSQHLVALKPPTVAELDQLQQLIAARLLLKAGESDGQVETRREDYRTDRLVRMAESDEEKRLPGKFIKIEKNLASLGFFTPSSKRIKSVKAKTISFTKTINGSKIEARVTIVPGALYGLPITADQDKYLALQNIITETKLRDGTVTNPVSFTSAQLLKLLHCEDGGNNFKEVKEWLNVMFSTSIISDGVVYLAGQRKTVTDRFRVFERAVSRGEEIDPGTVADKHYIWFSAWQLENINSNHLLPVDFETYNQLRNHIAKVLVPHLQIWLFASREKGFFEKRYDELCQILSVCQYQHASKIKEKMGPSLDELKGHGYLSNWKVEKTDDRKNFKIILYHGDKFYRDRSRRLGQKENVPEKQIGEITASVPEEGIDPTLLAEMTRRGITASRARSLLANLADGQVVTDQLEWGDSIIAQGSDKVRNPAGFYISLIKDNVRPPDNFESSRKREMTLAREQARDREINEKAELELAYDDYRTAEINNHIHAIYPEHVMEQLVEEKKAELKKKSAWLANTSDETITKMARSTVRTEISDKISFLDFGTFSKNYKEKHPPAIPLESNSKTPDGVGE